MSAEQASKRTNAEADPSGFRGGPLSLGKIATAPNGSAGVVAPACMEEEIDRYMGNAPIRCREKRVLPVLD